MEVSLIMNNKNEILKKQRDRLTEVLSYLKQKGISQSSISRKLDIDETTISHLKSGKIKQIPCDFLEQLQAEYSINPSYIRLESSCMLDTTGTKFCNFEKFVDSWNVLENNSHKYLHLTIDRNFYDFLLETVDVRHATDKGISSFNAEIENLKELYSGEPVPEEFVLIPRNNFIEIIKDKKQNKKYLNEVLDLIELTSYPTD